MEGEQLEFDFDESENKNELNGSGEPKRGPVTRICSRCGQPFILSAGTTDDMCWECCQEEKSEDEEQENARLFHGFSRDSKAFIPVETAPKKKTQKRKSLKEYTIPVRLNDEYDKSWIGKKICIKGGRGRGKTGTIVDVHKYRLNIVTDDGREYSEIYPDNVFMKPDATNDGAIHESRRRAFDDEPGWECNNGRGRSRMNDNDAIALDERVNGEYEDDENENEIRELEERIYKANEEINKKRREVDDEQYASDAQWERKKELISAQKKKADLVRELEEKRYGKAVVNEPSAKYLRGLKKAIDQGGRMKGGKSSGELPVNESEFMEALKEVGFGRAMCESINNIRKAVFEEACNVVCGYDVDSAVRDFEDDSYEQSMIREYRDEIAKKYFKELCDRIDDLENEAYYSWSRIENAMRDGVKGKELKEIEKEYYQCVAEKEVSLDKLKDKVNEKIIELNKSNPDEYPLVLVESRLGEMFAPAMKKVKNVALAGAMAGNMALAQPSDNNYYQNNYDYDSPAYDAGDDGWDNMTPDHLNAVSQDVGAKVTLVGGDNENAEISDMDYLKGYKKGGDYNYVNLDELFSNEVDRVYSSPDRDFVMGFGHGESNDIHEAARLAVNNAESEFDETMEEQTELNAYAKANDQDFESPLSENDEIYDIKYFYDEDSKTYHAFAMAIERGYNEWASNHRMEDRNSIMGRVNRVSKIRR